MCVAWRGHRMLHGILSFFSSTSETVLFLLSRCHRGADGLINRSLDVWQRFVFWFCCHTVVTRATCMFPVCYNGSVTTWRRDSTKIKQRRRMYPLRFGFPYHQLRYNKGVGWQNKAISWQPYSVLKRNKAMDDEIKDMFFFAFFCWRQSKLQKRKITQIFPYICSARVRLTFRDRPSLNPQLHRWVFCCELLSGAYLCVHYCLAL